MNDLYMNPVGTEEEPDGRETWLAEYKESRKMERNIKLTDPLQRKWFTQALHDLGKVRLQLTPYEYNFWEKLSDAWEMVGEEMTITVKQMNYLKQLAVDYGANSHG